MRVHTKVDCVGCGFATSFTLRAPSPNGRRVEHADCEGCGSRIEVVFTSARNKDGWILQDQIASRMRFLTVSPMLEELMKETELVSAKVASES